MQFEVDAPYHGWRLDRFLAEQAGSDFSRSKCQNMILNGLVTREGVPFENAAYKVKEGEIYCMNPLPPKPARQVGQKLDLDIVYEDDDVLVINKQVGLVVHPGAGNYDKTLVNGLIDHCGEELSSVNGEMRPGIVHRLDKDTSGLLVVAKSDIAHRALAAQFDDKSIQRTYIALVWGLLSPREGEVITQIGRHPKDRKKMAVLEHGGKTAHTLYHVKRQFMRPLSLVECTLQTGRTHQIRVHMHHLNHPLVGDPVYGLKMQQRYQQRCKDGPEELLNAKRQMLHAYRLEFIHPIKGELMEFEVDLPDDFKNLIKALEG